MASGRIFRTFLDFPQDTEESIHAHLDVLQSIAPNWASFYILCPIPGTEQYDTFLEDGLITERNLDRFDTHESHLATSQPYCSEIVGALMSATVNSLPCGIVSRALSCCIATWTRISRRKTGQSGYVLIYSLLCLENTSYVWGRCAWRLDHVSDYIDLRKRVFGQRISSAATKSEAALHPKHEEFNRSCRCTSTNSQSLSVI